MAEAGKRIGGRISTLSAQASRKLEPASRPRGSAFVGVKQPPTSRKETEMPILLWLLGVPVVVIVLLYLLNVI
ncbi:MAG TPA: hypothetical protein VFQ31_07465 [Methyloceanibacter sp.]|nr:hypothetical protein [Methyloceanibacter sp.]